MSMLKALMASAFHPKEISAMFRLKFGTSLPKVSHRSLKDDTLTPWEFCYAALNKVSRSFAVVIQQLPDEIKDAICVFYLVLRGLDTVEDDMAVPNEKKLPMLRVFHTHLTDAKWNVDGIGYDDELTLLQKFQNVTIVHQSLKPAYQAVISDICHRMADGMCDFAERKVQTVADYDLYCHYVAGLVGIGLSRIFSQSGLEAPGVGANEHMSNSMGLFLQKTNIIRDYLEDYVDERSFWPPEVWKNYASELGQLREDSIRSTKGLACLNHLIANAMEHVPDVLSYMSAIHNPQVFSFCAIPQVMAIATLAELYDNEKVFKGVVKIRKGLSARLMLNVGDMRSLKAWFRVFASQMRYKLRASDASSKRIGSLLDGIDAATADVADDTICQTNIVTPQWCAFRAATSVAIATFAACVGALFAHRRDRNALTFYADALGGMSEHTFVRLVYMLLVLSTVYLFAFVGVHVVPRKQAKTEPAVTEAKKEQKKQSSKSNLTDAVQRA